MQWAKRGLGQKVSLTLRGTIETDDRRSPVSHSRLASISKLTSAVVPPVSSSLITKATEVKIEAYEEYIFSRQVNGRREAESSPAIAVQHETC